MHDQHIPSGPLTPSELNLQDLSLLDVPKRTSYPAFPSRPVVQRNRASVYVVQSVVFDEYFSEILPNEVIIAFDRGKQVMKVDKYLLCNESRFFAKMLDGPFIHAHTRYIRLRDDFPYAIVAAVQFIETGIYIFDPNMRTKHPHITLLDLHIHAYLVGSKYDMPRLCDHAIAEYINVAQMILSLGVTSDTTCPSGPNECSPSAVTDRFLDSLVLLWKNTPNRYDPMREAVLELIKPALNMLLKLRFFVTLMMELVPFGDDIMHSLAEDGLDVKAFPLPAGVGRMWVVRFGEL
ncbi:uncharacterized protein K460DRAFT_281536 [Cucurbitaria berberidis CBS 394.84]|uniref:BTB domain-containing protein n=1 Tax=Cucurbitaria berberidis CBS 394.84 TaxID=1168544 RepID=A0A9P4GNW8_9PLEO|nr:uncharacterized protein K460DRAFT_281536 [Cucurbitaria berberidis CBS 394.84]KAF1848637.1 hypothetical protein K460DRAFT_281536 [Cucurbitaria berberidis CBS 394.84]